MGMQGTGSKRIVAEDAFVPAQRTIAAVGAGARHRNRLQRPACTQTRMYLGRIASFLIGEAASVAVGAARGALDLYEEVLRGQAHLSPALSRALHARAEFQAHFGRALGLDCDRRGGADPRRRRLHGVRARGSRRRRSRSATRRTSA